MNCAPLVTDIFYLDGDVPRPASYGVYISQQIRFASVSSHVTDFNTRNKLSIAKLLHQSCRYHKLHKAFYRCHFDLVSKIYVRLKFLLQQGQSEPEFYGDSIKTQKTICLQWLQHSISLDNASIYKDWVQHKCNTTDRMHGK